MTIYRGLGGVNREVKQQFRGLGGVNREIKEQYRGLSGVNRKVFSGKPPGAIYWEGDECVARTGGWTRLWTGAGINTITKYSDHIYAYSEGYSGQLSFATQNLLTGLDAYTKLRIEGSVTTNSSSSVRGAKLTIGIPKDVSSPVYNYYTYNSILIMDTMTIDHTINHQSREGYVGAYMNTGKYHWMETRIYRIWFE